MIDQIIRTSSDLAPNHWIARQLPPNTSLRGFAEDRAVSILTGTVLDAVEESGLTRAEIARVLGTTKSYVSQVLNGSTNMTLKTLGALLWVTGRQAHRLQTMPIGSAFPKPMVYSTYTIKPHYSVRSAVLINTAVQHQASAGDSARN